MMNIHTIFRNVAPLADMTIALKRFSSLSVPIWAIPARVTTLPAAVFLSAQRLVRAFTTTKAIFAVCSSNASERLFTVFTNESGFFADIKTALFCNAFTVAFLGAKRRNGVCIPTERVSLNGEYLATKLTGKSGYFSGRCFCSTLAFSRAIFALSFCSIIKRAVAKLAGVFYAGNRSSHCYTSDSMYREKNGGAFLGINACRQLAKLPKPNVKYNTSNSCCQGGLYAII